MINGGGAGFTEWANTKKSCPLFHGHMQPRTPLGYNYYNLLDDATKKWQVELARTYGVDAFCFYHYYFGTDKLLLEQPAQQYLANKSLDLPFCFCWANEPWTRRWDGQDKEILIEQQYGDIETWTNHFNYLLPFF